MLANEQVIDGKCWRHDGPDDPLVEKKEVKQWFFKITDYADELLEAIDDLDWTESVKLAQKNWIGKSTGAEVTFTTQGSLTQTFTVFTTRTDTHVRCYFHGACSRARPGTSRLPPHEQKRRSRRVRSNRRKLNPNLNARPRKNKTGVFTGAYAINPINGEEVRSGLPIMSWLATAPARSWLCQAQDERDYEFAEKFELRNYLHDRAAGIRRVR